MAGYCVAPVSKAYSHFLHKKAEHNLSFVLCSYALTVPIKTVLTQSSMLKIN
ncbi:hypothetical protein M917_1116 [Psychrobacter aquaticus CMS 56]|uniref:Uncharacterized protein n=1 Tax=Psychrobacter aquaticus CMS 56 TaxID=1354303 RepID=U4T7G8_9GAMM|nr:hypothetical protein M917_1116 [Psychrobacter aquaticus CMS 56]